MKIALFGGSFNPVHNEHVNIVKAAKRDLSLDKVIIMPSNITPQKQGRMTASCLDRLNMCRLAFESEDCAEVSDFEIEQGGVSYTYLTCREIKRRYPDAELYLILGADMYENFGRWKNPQEILKCATLAVCAREVRLNGLSDIHAVAINYIGARTSSTRLRTLAYLGEDISGYVSEKVANYIKEHNLYSIACAGGVKKYLTPDRWQHTVRVALFAAENCPRLNISEEKAVTAAVLHDCAKYLDSSRPELKGFICPDGVPEPVVHQYAGAFVAEKVFGINDEEILNAVRYHTSGRENMSDLEKLIFLSDVLEEGRNFKGVEQLRSIFTENIDKALYAVLEHQLEYLKLSGMTVYALTQKAFEYLKENVK